MPIQPRLQLRSVSDQEFEQIDDAVMRCAYASQNHFGHLFDERIYENDVSRSDTTRNGSRRKPSHRKSETRRDRWAY